MKMSNMRLFYALTFYPEDQQKLALYRDQIANIAEKGKFTLTDNLHLTLEFIGQVSPGDLKQYVNILDNLTYLPKTLNIHSVGTFTKKNKDIVWLGIKKNEVLIKLQKQLLCELEEIGYEPEKGKYKPHITLGRQVVLQDSGEININTIDIPIRSIALMESKRINNRLTYTVIDEIM